MSSLLRAFEKQFIVPPTQGFRLNPKHLQIPTLETDDLFPRFFLGHKGPPCERTLLQLYWLDRLSPADDVRAELGDKLCISPAQWYEVMLRQDTQNWLPAQDDDQLIIFFMRAPSGSIQELEITSWPDEHWPDHCMRRIDVAQPSDEFPANMIFIAQANAL